MFDSVEEKGVEYNHEIQGARREVGSTENQISEGQGAVSSTGRNVYPEVVSEKAGTYKTEKTKIVHEDDLAQLYNVNPIGCAFFVPVIPEMLPIQANCIQL